MVRRRMNSGTGNGFGNSGNNNIGFNSAMETSFFNSGRFATRARGNINTERSKYLKQFRECR